MGLETGLETWGELEGTSYRVQWGCEVLISFARPVRSCDEADMTEGQCGGQCGGSTGLVATDLNSDFHSLTRHEPKCITYLLWGSVFPSTSPGGVC